MAKNNKHIGTRIDDFLKEEGVLDEFRKRLLDREYLAAIEPMLSEWSSPEDAAAYDDLKPR